MVLRKWLGLFVVVAVVAIFSQASAAELRFAHASSHEGALARGMEYWAKLVAEKTEGRWIIKSFHNGQLGGERETAESCQLGNLDLAVVNQGPLGNFVPEFSVMDLPYLFTSAEHAAKVIDGEIGQSFLAMLDDVGLKGLAIWETGFRNLTNSKRPVNSLDDVKGLRIRVMENQIHQDLWRAFGADAVPMSWGEAYTAMQQGAIDGQENATTIIDKNNVVEVNKNMAITEHAFASCFIVMSPATWASIPPEDQKIFMDCMAEANVYLRKVTEEMNREAIEMLKSKGMAVTYPDKAPFIEKSKAVRDKYGSRYADTIAKIEALR